MLWLRAVVFSALVPGVVAFYVPWVIGPRTAASGFWLSGWVLVAAGAAIYLRCPAGRSEGGLVSIDDPPLHFSNARYTDK